MKRLLVAFILLLTACAYAETPALVRIRVKLPFEPDSPGAVVLPVGTRVTVLWPQDGKLMVRYRRVEGLVPAVTIDYVASAHPEDIRQYRPDPAPRDDDSPVAAVAHAANTYHAPSSPDRDNGPTVGSFPLSKVGIGAGVVLLVVIVSSFGRGRENNDGPLLRRQS